MSENFEVVYPAGIGTVQAKNVAPPLPDLNGKVIGLYWNNAFRGETTFPIIEELIKKQYPDVRFVPYTSFDDVTTSSHDSATAVKNLEKLPRKIKQLGCDAVILGNGC